MKVIAAIPARYHSERLPRKLSLPLGDSCVLAQTIFSVRATGLFEDVWVAADHDELIGIAGAAGAKTYRSRLVHSCGTDRIAEMAQTLATRTQADLIVNVQADEPFISADVLRPLLHCCADETVMVASAMHRISAGEASEKHCVSVVVDKEDFALYFSRASLPAHRDENDAHDTIFYKHIGVYAFRPPVLANFARMCPSALEIAEKIECLRLLENRIPIKMVRTHQPTISIDTAEDLTRAREHLRLLARP